MIPKWLVTLPLLLPLGAGAQAITYDFTGYVTSGGPTGATVTGTYTFNYAEANPSQSTGTVGSSNWSSNSFGGPAEMEWSSTPPSGFVFSSTAEVDGIRYATSAFSSYGGGSVIDGWKSGAPSSFAASEIVATSASTFNGSFFNYVAVPGSTPYTSSGLPVFSSRDHNLGAFYTGSSSRELRYTITSLTPAPEVDSGSAAGGLTLLLSGLALVTSGRRSAAHERKRLPD